jgi:hypothetical protein
MIINSSAYLNILLIILKQFLQVTFKIYFVDLLGVVEQQEKQM